MADGKYELADATADKIQKWGTQCSQPFALNGYAIYIYTLLGRPDLVQMIEVQYGKIPSPVYQRAWEIVSKIEGHEAFITELKNP